MAKRSGGKKRSGGARKGLVKLVPLGDFRKLSDFGKWAVKEAAVTVGRGGEYSRKNALNILKDSMRQENRDGHKDGVRVLAKAAASVAKSSFASPARASGVPSMRFRSRR